MKITDDDAKTRAQKEQLDEITSSAYTPRPCATHPSGHIVTLSVCASATAYTVYGITSVHYRGNQILISDPQGSLSKSHVVTLRQGDSTLGLVHEGREQCSLLTTIRAEGRSKILLSDIGPLCSGVQMVLDVLMSNLFYVSKFLKDFSYIYASRIFIVYSNLLA